VIRMGSGIGSTWHADSLIARALCDFRRGTRLANCAGMKRFGAWLVVGSVACALAAGACSDSDDGDEPGSGGSAGMSGSGGKGGSGGSAGSVSSGGAGGEAGGGAEACPTDFFEADGTPCENEGKECSDGGTDPCEFGNSIRCTNGSWEWEEAIPAPCGGAGGQGGANAGGEGGAAGGAQNGGVGGA
jgi:hypothetical protein